MKQKRNSLQKETNAFLQALDDYSNPPPPPQKIQTAPAIIPTHKIESYKDDCFSIAVPECYKVKINQYLGEQKNHIFQIISQHKKTILKANAGTGKNTLMIDLAKSGLVQRLGCERLVIVVMVTTVGAQSQKDFAKTIARKHQKDFESKGIDACFVSGVGDKFDKDITDLELGEAKVIIVVADSLPKIAPLIGGSLLAIDEFDGIGRQANKTFRAVAMKEVFKYSQLAKKVLLMSATPDLLYTTNLHKGFNYKLIDCQDNAPNKKSLSFVVCGHKVSRIDKLEYVENIEVGEGVIIIKLDNDELNEEHRLSYEKRGAAVEYFTSKRRERKDDNQAYQDLVSSGLLPPLDILLTTKLIDTGVSIKSAVALIASLDSRSWQEIVQLCARPRHNSKTGVNMHVEIVVFVPEQNKPDRINKTRVEQRFCNLRAETKAYCKAVNNKFGFNPSSNYTSGDLKNLATKDDNGIYYPSIPEILNELHRQETNETSLQLLKRKIERIDKRFEIDIKPFGKIELSPELLQLKDNIQTGRDAQKKYKADYIELLKNEPIETINAYLATSKNPAHKEKLQAIFQTGLLNKNSVSNFIAQNPVAVFCKDKGKIINYLAKLVDIGVDSAIILGMLANEKQGALKQYSDSKIIAYRHKNPHLCDAREKMECEIDKAIISGINKAKQNKNQGKYKNEMSKKILINIIKKRATKITDIYKNPILTDSQCFARLRTLFDFQTVAKKVKGKRITAYMIGQCKIELRGKKPQKK